MILFNGYPKENCSLICKLSKACFYTEKLDFNDEEHQVTPLKEVNCEEKTEFIYFMKKLN